MANRVLVVEDDGNLAACMGSFLRAGGYEVAIVGDAAAARRELSARPPDLVILDLMLPDGEGLDLCRELRAHSALPVIVISARGDGADRMLALECGADMYLAKPFELEELVARVASCLQRWGPEPVADRVQRGNLALDPASHRAEVSGRPLSLTPKEFALLLHLLQADGEVCASPELLWEVWGYGPEICTRTLDVHVGRLRRKLGEAGAAGLELRTVTGVGFQLRSVPPLEASA